jgi:hypothetical protein
MTNTPKILVGLDTSDQRHLSHTYFGDEPEDKVIFCSIKAKASPGNAVFDDCVGYVNAVCKMDDAGQWQPTAHYDRQHVTWGSQGDGDDVATVLDAELGRKLNIFSVRKLNPKIKLCVPQPLNKHKNVFDDRHATYRLDICVFAYRTDVEMGRIFLKVTLGEQWDDIRVEVIND